MVLPGDLSEYLNRLYTPVKRRVFLSYHHGGDQAYYNAFSQTFHDGYESIFDNSLERQIDSDDVNYVMQRIRDEFISGTSFTIVLCGAGTPWRKYVDWEIKATLDMGHGIIGVELPSCVKNAQGQPVVPGRLFDNTQSGYAVWTNWTYLTQNVVNLKTQMAIPKSASLIRNSREMMARNVTA
jgi:hypothetical protein